MQKYIKILYFIIFILFLNLETIFPKNEEVKIKETKTKKEIHIVLKKSQESKIKKETHSDSKKELKEKKKKQVNLEFEVIQKKESLFSFFDPKQKICTRRIVISETHSGKNDSF